MPYSDYPEVMTSNAKRGLELNEENGGKCATAVGKETARILSSGESLSEDRVVRMYSYLSRAETYYDENDTTACGTISYLMWGGKPALAWSKKAVEEMEENRAMDVVAEEIIDAIDEHVEELKEEIVEMLMGEEEEEIMDEEEEEEMVDERKANSDLESRSFACEFRTEGEDETIIEGYAARYDEETEIGGQFVERISKGAFDSADMTNVVALFNHDWNMPLARVGKGLELWDDGQGLKYRFTLGNQSYAKDLAENIRMGNVSTSSFGFTVDKDRWEKRNGQPLRVVERVKKLYDVSPTTQGAYPTTDVAIKRMQEFNTQEVEQRLTDTTILPNPYSPETQTPTTSTMENNVTPAYIQSLGDSEASVSKRFSFGKAIKEAAEGRLTGLEAEMNQEARREFTNAKVNVAGGISIPSMVLRNHTDPMSLAATSNGTNHQWGGTVGTIDAGLIPYMSPRDIASQMGVRNLTGLSGNVVFQVAKPDVKLAAESPAEGVATTQDAIEFAAKTLAPTRYSAYVRATEQLLAQSADDMGAFIAAEIRKAVDKKFNADIIAAIKTGAQTNGTASALEAYNASSKNPITLESELLGRDVDLNMVKVLCAPNAYRAARTLSLDAGSGFLFASSPLERRNVLGYETVISSQVTAGDFYMFDYTQLVTGEWGGLNLIIDPYSDAHKGVVRILANVYKDVTTLQDECYDGLSAMPA